MASQFISNSTVTYDVSPEGVTTVTHDITLRNTTADFYATSYTLSLSGITPILPKAYQGNQALPLKVNEDNGTTSLEVTFPDAVLGKDRQREFFISFQDRTFVSKTGEVWEITTPKLADSSSFETYSTIMKIPNSFGNLAYISPNPITRNQDANQMIFGFDKQSLSLHDKNTSITAAFGKFQVFSFNLTYHIENPLSQTATTDIALPPDTNYQKMNYSQITPKPDKVWTDADGNWLATYSLKPHEKVDVRAIGTVQIFASKLDVPRINSKNVVSDLAPSDLWQTNDPQIKSLANQLKTPKAIYDYVTSTLSYDYSRVAPNVERIGAVRVLQNPKSAICTEFTDLFIALSRAAGIPAREIEGYAYTENAQLQPLSLVADVLHAWPEYWDSQKQAWIPVDPTWGATSSINYFDKLDLRHFAFVIHGTDSRKPYPAGSYKLGPNPQKDINITFGQLNLNVQNNVTVDEKIISELPFSDEQVKVSVRNNGTQAIYDQDLKINFDSQNLYKQVKMDALPPYGSFETNVNVPYSFLGQKTPKNFQVLIGNVKKSEFTTYKIYVTISNLLMLCLFVFFIVTFIYLKFRDAKTKKHS